MISYKRAAVCSFFSHPSLLDDGRPFYSVTVCGRFLMSTRRCHENNQHAVGKDSFHLYAIVLSSLQVVVATLLVTIHLLLDTFVDGEANHAGGHRAQQLEPKAAVQARNDSTVRLSNNLSGSLDDC